MESTWDAVIAGAGPAGSTLATLLARRGWRVALVDPAFFPRQKVCGEFMGPSAWPVFERLGVEQLVRDGARSVQALRVAWPGGNGIEVPVPPSAEHAPANVTRYRLDELLLKRAAAAGVEVRLGYRVREVLVENGRVCGLTARSNSPHDEPLVLRAKAVIAADGRASQIVKQTGALRRRGSRLIGFKRHCAVDAAHDNNALTMHSLPGGYIGVSRVDDNHINVCGVLPRRALAAAQGSFELAIVNWAARDASLAPLVAPGPEASRWWTMADVATQRARPKLPGVLYIGDACGTIEPLAGQGMTMALVSATLAERALFESHGEPLARGAQVAYDAAWDAQFAANVRRAYSLGWLLRRPRLIAGMTRVVWSDLARRIFGSMCHGVALAEAH